MTVYASTVLFTQSSFAMAASKRASVATICSCCAAILSTFALSCPIPSLEPGLSMSTLDISRAELADLDNPRGVLPARAPCFLPGANSDDFVALRPTPACSAPATASSKVFPFVLP